MEKEKIIAPNDISKPSYRLGTPDVSRISVDKPLTTIEKEEADRPYTPIATELEEGLRVTVRESSPGEV